MSTLAIVLIVLVVLVLFGGFMGRGSYGGNAYYGPGIGIFGLLLIVLLILVLTGNLNL